MYQYEEIQNTKIELVLSMKTIVLEKTNKRNCFRGSCAIRYSLPVYSFSKRDLVAARWQTFVAADRTDLPMSIGFFFGGLGRLRDCFPKRRDVMNSVVGTASANEWKRPIVRATIPRCCLDASSRSRGHRERGRRYLRARSSIVLARIPEEHRSTNDGRHERSRNISLCETVTDRVERL